jgi:16S rRNA (cytidine1402-2'-O)-methyltransferase
MAEVLGDREAFLCREATKVHEEYVRGRVLEIAELLTARDTVRGEIVLVVAGATESTPAEGEDATALYSQLTADGRITRRAAVKEVARRLGLPAREVYRRVLEAEKDVPPAS